MINTGPVQNEGPLEAIWLNELNFASLAFYGLQDNKTRLPKFSDQSKFQNTVV